MTVEYQLLTPTPQIPPYVTEGDDNFSKGVEFVLSVIIILADFTMTFSYSLIIFKTTLKKKKTSSNQEQS